MTRYKLSTLDLPSIHKFGVGFDQLFDELGRTFANSSNSTNYPPYNVLKHDEDNYELQIAVSGFDKENITVEIDQNLLTIKGRQSNVDAEGIEYLHRGLATRDFTRTFPLAQHLEVGEGRIKNGILSIDIKRVIPEALKPRLVKIISAE